MRVESERGKRERKWQGNEDEEDEGPSWILAFHRHRSRDWWHMRDERERPHRAGKEISELSQFVRKWVMFQSFVIKRRHCSISIPRTHRIDKITISKSMVETNLHAGWWMQICRKIEGHRVHYVQWVPELFCFWFFKKKSQASNCKHIPSK